MDIYDQATVQEEMMRDIALKAARAPIKRLMPNGTCYNCEASLSHAG